ncbi:actin-like ATPase domain-containing protein [Aspergillus indologenus CBS 114.80]|uniref:Actin-like ATPase domain-containing protein n=1 Tax=Aspergillus indologenus CBS 114.80 TaxID=1450541 RepID=A0A2V5JIV4_9EURO|nr:actin-like ATPase domain-containing protein [Aspergillus indologenus CBS 114.80]
MSRQQKHSSSMSIKKEEGAHRIIVGVDYGTTYTGDTDLRDIKHICNWPGPTKETEIVFKAPSRIAYPDGDLPAAVPKWGYEVQPGMTAYSWTKLLLDSDTPWTQYDDSTLEYASQTGILQLPPGRTAIGVVADYLTQVYQFTLKTLAKQITEQALRITPIEFWFTVPAIWSDKAMDATRTAALRAGFGPSASRPEDRIFLISEPEAAAVTALHKYTTCSMGGSVKADGVLVCDCGGGTVVSSISSLLDSIRVSLSPQDLTTFLVTQTSPVLTFEELCAGIGGKCGSSAIDRSFYRLMFQRFGSAFENLSPRYTGPGSSFMNKFEIVKRGFGQTPQTSFELPLKMKLCRPDPAHYDEEERLVTIDENDLHAMFNPVVDKVLSLVRQQIDDAKVEAGKDVVNRIILVGGFGDSEYLHQEMVKAFGSNGKITVTVPNYAQAAIVQGAALRGLQGLQPTTRRCRRHYGFKMSMLFEEGVDDESDAYIDEWTGLKYTARFMKWMISKGGEYKPNYTHTVPLCIIYDASQRLQSSQTLYACDRTNVQIRSFEGIYPVGEIITDFTNTDLSRFETKVIDGKLKYRLDYETKVIFGAEEGVLKFESTSQGRTIGQTSIRFKTVKFY